MHIPRQNGKTLISFQFRLLAPEGAMVGRGQEVDYSEVQVDQRAMGDDKSLQAKCRRYQQDLLGMLIFLLCCLALAVSFQQSMDIISNFQNGLDMAVLNAQQEERIRELEAENSKIRPANFLIPLFWLRQG